VKLGILSDIHEDVELLTRAIERLEGRRVDRLILLGDVFETGVRIGETVDLLGRAKVTGVYGNHDYGLSVAPGDYVRERYSPEVLAYMTTLVPRLELEGCSFAHREPWLDCSEIAQIWHIEEEPFRPEQLARSFDAVPHAAIFLGHFHTWKAFEREGELDWRGGHPLFLPPDRPTMVVINGVCEGFAAVFDTSTRILEPIELYEAGTRPENRPIPALIPG
jgi:predicted phosphodiesterase